MISESQRRIELRERAAQSSKEVVIGSAPTGERLRHTETHHHSEERHRNLHLSRTLDVPYFTN